MPSLLTDRFILPPLIEYSSSTGLVYTSAPKKAKIGFRKIFQGSNDGFFVPGKFRVNPVYIAEAVGTQQAGFIHHTKASNPNDWFKATGLFGTNFLPTVMPDGQWDSSLAQLSSNKAIAKTHDVQLELGVFLGELRETLEMLKNPFQALRKFLRKKKKGPGSLISLGADGWLMYKYGIMPLLMDIQAAIDYFNKKATKAIGMSRRRATQTSSSNNYSDNASGYLSLVFGVRTDYTTEVKSTSIVYFQKILDNSLRHDLSKYGLSPTQLPEVLWELVPYSFVVDWFLDVGTWLRAISPNASANLMGLCTSQVVTNTVTVQTHETTPVSGYVCTTHNPSKYEYTSKTLIRQLGSTMPTMMPAFKGFDLDLGQTITSLALIWQQLYKE